MALFIGRPGLRSEFCSDGVLRLTRFRDLLLGTSIVHVASEVVDLLLGVGITLKSLSSHWASKLE